MKRKSLTIICILSLVVVACHNSQDNGVKQDGAKTDSVKQVGVQQNGNFVTSPYDSVGLFTKLYPGSKIIHKVTKEKKFRILVATGDNYFTNIDTIIKIPRDKNNMYAIIFTAFNYTEDGERDGSHASGATYDIALVNKNSGKIVNFCRNIDTSGSFGEGGFVSLEDFGKVRVLRITKVYTGQGETFGSDDYYSIDSSQIGKDIFSFNSYYSNDGIFDFDSASGELKSDMGLPVSEYKTEERKLIAVPNSIGEWDKLELREKFARYDSINHKMKDSVSTKHYRMNESKNSYEKEGK